MTSHPTGQPAATDSGATQPVLALDLGGTRLRAALVAPDGSVRHRRESRTPRDADAATLVGACAALLEEVHDASAGTDAAARALGISAPGPLDPGRGVLLEPPNLSRGLWDFPLAGALEARTGLPAFVQKDTNVAAMAEQHFGAARGVDDFVYLTVSTGVGGAVVSGGHLLAGADGVAGELGHLVVDLRDDARACGCGGRGHLEALSSGTGIAAAARAALAADRVARDSPLALAAAERGGGLEARDVALAADQGDATAAEIMGRARSAFAAALVSIVNVFNPSLVVVGGGIAFAQAERLLGPARERVRRESFRTAAATVRIVPAELGDDVGLVGALPLVATMFATSSGRMDLPSRAAGSDDVRDAVETPDRVSTAAVG